MDQCSLMELLGQASVSEAGGIFREYLRGGVRMMLAEVMSAEVAALCGAKYYPTEEASCRRSGSTSGYVVWEGNREDVKRPRVRCEKGDGSTEEVRLRTYESARQLDQLHAMVLRALTAGVSGREMGNVHPEQVGRVATRRIKSQSSNRPAGFSTRPTGLRAIMPEWKADILHCRGLWGVAGRAGTLRGAIGRFCWEKLRTIRNVLVFGYLRESGNRSERDFVTNNGRVSAGSTRGGGDMIYMIYRMEGVGGKGVMVGVLRAGCGLLGTWMLGGVLSR